MPITILNKTPHEIRILDSRCVVSDRFGHYFLRHEAVPEALRALQPDTIPLSVVDIVSDEPDLNLEGIPYSASLSTLAFNQQLGDFALEGFDIVLVSSKVATVINAKLPGLLFPQNIYIQNPLSWDIISLDRLYSPLHLVKQGGNIIGCLGFRKVTYELSLIDYVPFLASGRQVSVASLCRVCQNYCSIPVMQRQSMAIRDGGNMERSLAIANQYLSYRGFSTYPTLQDLGYGMNM
jgi:hypothetical protein